ncbi:MAG: Ribulose bisphosphate carboxylase large chain [Parcubacteria group bacterium ADurb.Bin159]|nr:MAG: Ribulose bisphosphate carboxylase large chain [Parcubacteria group bacterium ADurb.Bin159]
MFKPDLKKYLISTLFLEPNKVSLKQAAESIAAESSIGTWTELNTLSQNIQKKLKAIVFEINPKTKIIKIAYPLALFEKGSIPQFLSNSAGNIFSMKLVKNLRLIDVDFPSSYIQSFPGPQIGKDNIKKIFKVTQNRPLIGLIMKPKLGLNPKEQANLTYLCFIGGVDLVKDDENLTNQNFNRFEKRVEYCLKAQRRAEKETGRIKICVFNITAETEEMIKRAKLVKKMGGRAIMVDVITAGFAALQTLRKQNLGLIIHAHRAMHSVMTRNKKHGISMLVLAKLLRLAGVDQLHTGTIIGKMEGGEEDVLKINNFLTSPWAGLKPVLPIASGGLHPELVPKLMKILGRDIIMNFGGGVHGHPEGTLAGAKAVYQAVEATCQNIPLKKYAKNHHELFIALEHFKK